jgi:hypothetical protein
LPAAARKVFDGAVAVSIHFQQMSLDGVPAMIIRDAIVSLERVD